MVDDVNRSHKGWILKPGWSIRHVIMVLLVRILYCVNGLTGGNSGRLVILVKASDLQSRDPAPSCSHDKLQFDTFRDRRTVLLLVAPR